MKKNYNLQKGDTPQNPMQQILANNGILKNIIGDEDTNLMSAISNIMGNENVMSKILTSGAFKDIEKATENQTEFTDIFQTVFKQVATNKGVYDMVTDTTKTLQEELNNDQNLKQSIMDLESSNNEFITKSIQMCNLPSQEAFKIILEVDSSNPSKVRSNAQKFREKFRYSGHELAADPNKPTGIQGYVKFQVISRCKNSIIKCNVINKSCEKQLKKKIFVENPNQKSYELTFELKNGELKITAPDNIVKLTDNDAEDEDQQ